VVAIAGSGVVLAIRGFQLWRTIRSFGRGLTKGLADLTETAAATEAHAVGVAGRTERLLTATEQLQASLAQLSILTDAANDARRSLLGFKRVFPKK
jgi:ABC-type transporter Mla subunit MlaD